MSNTAHQSDEYTVTYKSAILNSNVNKMHIQDAIESSPSSLCSSECRHGSHYWRINAYYIQPFKHPFQLVMPTF